MFWKEKKSNRKIKHKFLLHLFSLGAVISVIALGRACYLRWSADVALQKQQEILLAYKEAGEEQTAREKAAVQDMAASRHLDAGVIRMIYDSIQDAYVTVEQMVSPQVLEEYRAMYEQNKDMVGWLTIPDTVIDYPIMQTPEDEGYYLTRGFDKEDNSNGCLLLDTDDNVGTGTGQYGYLDGSAPSTNLIIHGHTMKSGQMFGNLKLYKEEKYGKEHSTIYFDSLYEKRQYELIAVFYSQVYYESDDVFKYYKFFEADTQKEFDNWYDNIKEMSLYDTGVTAEYGDEFITLSCCAYHVQDGRFVVVGKRI